MNNLQNFEQMILPTLKKGDRIAIAAPARKVTAEEMAPAIATLESWGLEVIIPQGLYKCNNQMAGEDYHRARLLQDLIDDDSIQAVLCARGGYGTVRMVDMVNFDRLKQHPKWIIGYSDITVLHSHLHQTMGYPTLHATMPINFPIDGSECPATQSLLNLLFGNKIDYSFSPNLLSREGEVSAPIVGGNLSILYSLLGSKSDIDTRDKILFIEDLDEYLYHIDRMMMALKRAGKLDGLKGLIVGAFTEMHDNSTPFGRTAEEIIYDCVKEYNYPVLFGAQFGHIGTQNLALPLGISIQMSVSKKNNSSLKC